MPIQRLFGRRDQRIYHDVTKEDLVARIGDFLRQAQFYISFVTPYQIHAEQYYQKLGLRRVMDIYVYDEAGGVVVTADFSASLGETEAAVGILGAALILPVAVAVGAVSYLDYESDAQSLMASMWSYLASTEQASGPAPEMTLRCGNCGLEVDPDSKFCKQCGSQLKV